VEILTYGCAVNKSDSEIMRGLAAEAGLEGADLVVVNTCTVKTPTENKIVKVLRKLRDEGRAVVVAGCMPAARPALADEFPGFSFIGTDPSAFVPAARAALEGKRAVDIGVEGEKSAMPCIRESPYIGIIQISSGCLGSCSYCQTRLARGSLRSYPAYSIVERAKEVIGDGAGEIWLTSQDTGAYGKDIGTSLPELLGEVAEQEGDFRVRVGMMNPNHALSMLPELIDAFDQEKVYKFAHIPVQSGDDGVLEDMGRRYTVAEFEKVAKAFQGIGATVSTDLIVGYPTEDEAAFQGSVELLTRVAPDVVNITRFWQRPGTPAAGLAALPGSETKRRSGIMVDTFKRVGKEKNSGWVGWEGRAYASKAASNGTVTARNDMYKPIIVKGGDEGQWMRVRVTGSTYYDLRGEIL